MLVFHSHQVRISSIRLRDCDADQVFVFPGHPRFRIEQARICSLKDSLRVCLFFVNEHLIERQTLYPRERHANERSGKIEEMAGDIQYLMQAFTGLEDRLSKIEGSGADQGIDP